MHRSQTCGGWLSVLLKICPKDVKEHMMIKLYEIGENYKKLEGQGGVTHDQQDRATTRRTERDVCTDGGKPC